MKRKKLTPAALEEAFGGALVVRQDFGNHYMAAISGDADWDICRLNLRKGNLAGQLAGELRRIADRYRQLARLAEQVEQANRNPVAASA
jgi:hypothetical protein